MYRVVGNLNINTASGILYFRILAPTIMSKTLTVFGATGVQGGSVARAILNHSQLSKEYKVRGVTRDAMKPASKALGEQWIEVVQVQRT
jgi:hypothetical protein